MSAVEDKDPIHTKEMNSQGEQDQQHESQSFFKDRSDSHQLLYHIDENPPWHTSILLGFQHYLMMVAGTVAVPLLLAKFMCAGNNGLFKGNFICTIFFASGIVTLFQTTLGVRLPIVQGATFAFLAPTLAILNLPEWKCPEMTKTKPQNIPTIMNSTVNVQSTKDLHSNGVNTSCWENVCFQNKTLNSAFTKRIKVTTPTTPDVTTPSPPQREDPDDPDIWKPRMREIQGAIMVASLMQVIIGATGTMGFLMKYIGPLTITPTISLIGLSLFDVAAESAAKHWGTSILTIVLMILFSQYLRKIEVPVPSYNRTRGFHKEKARLFELFSIIFAVAIAWIFCIILTATDHFPPGHGARTDGQLSVFYEAPWFRVPYPGQWGTPTVSIAAVIGMFAGVLAGIIESVGDYYACARLSCAPPVPKHALNRGILIEGIGCVLAGAFGGTGTTSYSQNVGAIGLTKVGSRGVVQISGLLMIALAVLGKFGALFATIPEPIVGGMFIILFSVICAVGISNLQYVDLNSTRNLFIIGFSMFFGLVVPTWIHDHPDVINTGFPALDQILFVQLDTSMWVGGLLGFILDNTLSGTDEERGILKWRELQEGHEEDTVQVASIHTYDIPFITPFMQKFPFVRYAPFLPYYGNERDETGQL